MIRLGVAAISIIAILNGCGTNEKNDSPLALTASDTQVVSAALAGTGALDITAECVVLDLHKDGKVTLVFRLTQALWDSAHRTIAFNDPFAGTLTLTSGATVKVGGKAIGHWNGAEPPATVRWIVPPHSSCPAELFEVHTLVIE